MNALLGAGGAAPRGWHPPVPGPPAVCPVPLPCVPAAPRPGPVSRSPRGGVLGEGGGGGASPLPPPGHRHSHVGKRRRSPGSRGARQGKAGQGERPACRCWRVRAHCAMPQRGAGKRGYEGSVGGEACCEQRGRRAPGRCCALHRVALRCFLHRAALLCFALLCTALRGVVALSALRGAEPRCAPAELRRARAGSPRPRPPRAHGSHMEAARRADWPPPPEGRGQARLSTNARRRGPPRDVTCC